MNNMHKHVKIINNNDDFHLKIIIESKKLKSIDKIEAHKKIFSILKHEMKTKIHALEIEIN